MSTRGTAPISERPAWNPASTSSTESAPVVRGDTVWLIATDELDVQYVVRGRIRAS